MRRTPPHGQHDIPTLILYCDKRDANPPPPSDIFLLTTYRRGLIYSGRLWTRDDKFELNPFVTVTGKTPPTFLVHAEDDDVNSVNHSLVYYVALKKAGVPAEMHLYAQGGHAFGLRRTKLPITDWPQLVEKWLGKIGMISQ